MMLNHLLHLSSMIVLITTMPNIPTNYNTTEDLGTDYNATEELTETPDPHNTDSIVENCNEGKITIVKDEDSHELGELLGIFRPTFYSLDYGINGTFYTIKDEPHKIYIEKFSYSGNAPLVYFYIGLTENSGVNNFYVPKDYHSYDPCDIKDGIIIGTSIPKFVNQSVILHLPSDFTIYNIRWVMVWCRVFALDMGYVWNLHYKESSRRKRESSHPETTDMLLLGKIAGRMYGVNGTVYAIDSTTLFLSNFSYNGKAPDAYFYAGYTEKIGENGTIIPDENGSKNSIGAYENQNVTLSLPDGFTIKDFKWLSIFCDSFLQDFGHIRYDHLGNESLDMLDVQPIDTITSENQTEMIIDLESANESNVSYVSSELEQENLAVSAQENLAVSAKYYESEKEPKNESENETELVPEPEPGVDSLARVEDSDSTGMGALTGSSYYIIPITIGCFFLFR